MIKALVVDDSAYNRVTITRMLSSDPRIEVVASAVNGEDAIKQLLKHNPDVVTLDLEMPVMDGFAFLRWVMHNKPTAVIAVSSKTSDRSVFKALELGAVDFIAKPGGRVSPRLGEIERDLLEKIVHVAEVRLDNLKRRAEAEGENFAPADTPSSCDEGIELVAIGCSTGGPPALQQLFQAMRLLPVPFVVAQHMPATFTRLFAERVNRLTKYEVKEASNDEPLLPGVVYIAPGGRQLQIERDGDLRARISAPEPDDIYSPSVDRLLTSASKTLGEHLIAVIMTGMGDDGARGIRAVRARGGRTIAESSESAIIFGMPNEAIKTGCVDEILSLDEIPSAIERLCVGEKDEG